MHMRLSLYLYISCCLLAGCAVHQPGDRIVDTREVSRILNTLASDDMEGRAAFTPGIEKAADFIIAEFEKIGLHPYSADSYRQTVDVTRITPASWEVTLDGVDIAPEHVIVSSRSPGINWNADPGVSVMQIKAGEDFVQRLRQIPSEGKDAIVVVDPSFAGIFQRYQGFLMRERVDQAVGPVPSIVYVLAADVPTSFRVSFTNAVEQLPISNIIGVLPGKSKPEEYVVFSAHYDHIGIIEPVGQDSIANGADDNASGVSAVISLANYYKKQGDNERTLLFVAFTAEELGLVGSTYFSGQLNADEIVAMINIEMIGKDSKFGPNSLFVTGYDRSDLAALMQKNVEDTGFSFHPDPYPAQNLFYRSDNASLAEAGVPAHSFSTVQIDQDQYYHTVKDEVQTLDVENIVSSIKAIALGARGLVMGEDTPTRVSKRTE